MPGYIMHLAEERMILDKISEMLPISESWEQRFRTGTLLPDTKLRDEKPLSHFWKPEEADLLARLPDLKAFTEKYASQLQDPLVFGYLAHLHLDLLYLRDFWPAYIRFYNLRLIRAVHFFIPRRCNRAENVYFIGFPYNIAKKSLALR